MRHAFLTLFFTALVTLAGIECASADPTFRQPFKLKLHVDKDHYYEEEFKPIPYVFKGDIYLFKGDAFGVKLDRKGNPYYEPHTSRCDVCFKFTQEIVQTAARQWH